MDEKKSFSLGFAISNTVLDQQSPVNTVSESNDLSRQNYMKMVFWSPFRLEIGSEWQPLATENLRPLADIPGAT